MKRHPATAAVSNLLNAAECIELAQVNLRARADAVDRLRTIVRAITAEIALVQAVEG